MHCVEWGSSRSKSSNNSALLNNWWKSLVPSTLPFFDLFSHNIHEAAKRNRILIDETVSLGDKKWTFIAQSLATKSVLFGNVKLLLWRIRSLKKFSIISNIHMYLLVLSLIVTVCGELLLCNCCAGTKLGILRCFAELKAAQVPPADCWQTHELDA